MLSRHLKNLEECFNLHKSPIELSYNNQVGFGVVATKINGLTEYKGGETSQATDPKSYYTSIYKRR